MRLRSCFFRAEKAQCLPSSCEPSRLGHPVQGGVVPRSGARLPMSSPRCGVVLAPGLGAKRLPSRAPPQHALRPKLGSSDEPPPPHAKQKRRDDR